MNDTINKEANMIYSNKRTTTELPAPDQRRAHTECGGITHVGELPTLPLPWTVELHPNIRTNSKNQL